jgi:hypothetical protein
MTQAIETKYFPPTNSRGSRIKVSAQAGSIFVPWDPGLSEEDNYAAAARAYAKKMGWTGKLVGGSLRSGDKVFVFDYGISSEVVDLGKDVKRDVKRIIKRLRKP